MAVWDGNNFCKAFAGAQVHISHITSGESEKLNLTGRYYM